MLLYTTSICACTYLFVYMHVFKYIINQTILLIICILSHTLGRRLRLAIQHSKKRHFQIPRQHTNTQQTHAITYETVGSQEYTVTGHQGTIEPHATYERTGSSYPLTGARRGPRGEPRSPCRGSLPLRAGVRYCRVAMRGGRDGARHQPHAVARLCNLEQAHF